MKRTSELKRCVLMFMLATAAAASWRGAANPTDAASQFEAKEHVSLISLIANGERYHGRTVMVRGFLGMGFELCTLFTSPEDVRRGVSKNGVYIQFDRSLLATGKVERFKNKWVILQGVYNATNHGHMDLNSGAIEHVDRIKRIK